MCECVVMSAGTFKVQKKMSDSLELELQLFVSCSTWMLGTEFRSYGNIAGALNH